ncbi:MAG: ferritin-like domain-containing protein [Actinomycetota bacterium]|nr:ferritin-like domain-containing protein [Actinomycetota bacterium]
MPSSRPDDDASRCLCESRRSLLRQLGVGLGTVGGRGVLAGGFGAAVLMTLSSPVEADTTVDAHILQTASSLEILMLSAYRTALELPVVTKDNAVLASFSTLAGSQHDEHRQAFQVATNTLKAPIQNAANPKYSSTLAAIRPSLKTAKDVVMLVAMLEEVITATYVSDLAMMSDPQAKKVMAKVVGVEAQHLAVLRMFAAFVDGGMAQLLHGASSDQLARLPPAMGTVAFPVAFATTTDASPPDEGSLP